MGRILFPTASDVKYIDHISRPRVTIVEQMVKDNTLTVNVEMEPQEIQMIHIFRQYEEKDV